VGNTLFQPEDSIAYATSVIMIQDLRGLENDGQGKDEGIHEGILSKT
jgi:hypothetical protein